MRYWPLSMIAKNPFLHHTTTWELMCAYQVPPSKDTINMCISVLSQVPAQGEVALVAGMIGEDTHTVYVRPPTRKEFASLERGGFIADNMTGEYRLHIDILH